MAIVLRFRTYSICEPHFWRVTKRSVTIYHLTALCSHHWMLADRNYGISGAFGSTVQRLEKILSCFVDILRRASHDKN